ncbi:hypothetical protein [Variovorax paradoxus]|uniref:hypothetical protein n=1 Tax=Variovorax paradoxus TaxID=34073 RepID=UPI003D66262A
MQVNDLQGFFVFPARRFRVLFTRFFPPKDPVPVQQAMWCEPAPLLALATRVLRQPTELCTEKQDKSSA